MTTSVTVYLANHDVTVQMTEGPHDDQTVTTEYLKAGEDIRQYYVYGDRVITVKETS